MAEPSTEAIPRTVRSPEPGRRRWKIAAAAVPVAAVLGIVAAHGPITEALLRRRAAALGFDLDFDDYEMTGDGVRLTRARVGLEGVDGVRVTAGKVDLRTHWLTVDAVNATGVAVTVEGSASDRVLELAAWSGDHAGTYALPGGARDVRLEWRANEGSRPWLTMAGGVFASDGKVARFQAASSTAFGVPLGAMGAGFVVDGKGVTVEAGKKAGGEAPVVAAVHTDARPPTIAVTLRPVELSALGTALALSLPGRGATASGRADLTLGRAGVAGSASLDLDGWVPPHPAVLDGVITGKKTSVKTKIRFAEDRNGMRFEDLEVHAGRFAMTGSGSVADENNRTIIRLDLSGPVACGDLAKAVAKEELGPLGALAGDVAQRALAGSAVVSVSVEANARDLGAAKVKPTVGVGCSLRL